MAGAGRRPIFFMLAIAFAVTVTAAETAQTGVTFTEGHARQAGKIWSGVYSATQVERGKIPFVGICRRCHGDDLGGTRRGPALRGEKFISNWEAQDLKRLYDKIRDTMPPDNPSSLDDDEYLDVVSYILQANAYPAGTQDLTAEAIEDIQIMRKPGEGPGEARNFSVVEVVGCLTEGPDHVWMLTNTSEPVLTRERPSTAEELEEAVARPLGTHTFRLVSVAPFKPEAHKGQKMEAKGLVYRAPNKDRLNLNSLQMVASSCTN